MGEVLILWTLDGCLHSDMREHLGVSVDCLLLEKGIEIFIGGIYGEETFYLTIFKVAWFHFHSLLMLLFWICRVPEEEFLALHTWVLCLLTVMDQLPWQLILSYRYHWWQLFLPVPYRLLDHFLIHYLRYVIRRSPLLSLMQCLYEALTLCQGVWLKPVIWWLFL